MNKINEPILEREPTVDTLPPANRSFTNRLCWSSIFGGAIVALGLGFLLHLYSAAIGLSAYSSSSTGASVIAFGGFLGLLLGTIAAMATAGFVAGYLGRYHYYHISGGIIYGFITWSLALFLIVIASGPMGHYINSYSNTVLHSSSIIDKTPKVQITNDKEANDNNSPIPNYQNTTDATAKKVTPTKLAWSGWIIFLLFFFGAISTCIGAIFGMKCRKEASENYHPL